MPFPDFDQLRHHEGLELTAYLDTERNWTIGYGHLMDDEQVAQHLALVSETGCGLTWTAEHAEEVFRQDVRVAQNECERYPWFCKLSDNRRNVILDMMFNMGATRFGKFINMLGHLRNGEYTSAAAHMKQSLWYRQVKNRAKVLIRMMEHDVPFAEAVRGPMKGIIR